jgi:PAS domain S-box-containing protein
MAEAGREVGGRGGGGDTHGRTLGEAAYRALYDNSPDGVLFSIPDGRILAANAAACQILGRTEAEMRLLGRQGMSDLSDPRWEPILAERERTGQVRGVARMIRGDGLVIEVEMSARIFREPDGEDRGCTIIRDVTERVAMERALRESRERLAEAERVAQMGSWEWDVAGGRVSWSSGLLQIHQLEAEEFLPTPEGVEQLVYPDDRRRLRAAIERALAERSSFACDYRAVRSDGRVRTLHSRGEVIVNGSGEPVRVVGIVQDVSDAKLAQDALHSTSLELERRALELQRLALQAGNSSPRPPHAPLSSRQMEILRLIADGRTSGQIAKQLFLTEGTVKWHVKQILAKTGSANRAEAVARVLGRSG